jgi:plasmid stabilization system protein ParE
MKVRYTPQARSDLEAILQYLSSHSPQGMRNLRRAFENTERLIGQYPYSGRMSQVTGARVLPVGRYPYLVYRAVEASEASIVHIRDGRRKPWRGE